MSPGLHTGHQVTHPAEIRPPGNAASAPGGPGTAPGDAARFLLWRTERNTAHQAHRPNICPESAAAMPNSVRRPAGSTKFRSKRSFPLYRRPGQAASTRRRQGKPATRDMVIPCYPAYLTTLTRSKNSVAIFEIPDPAYFGTLTRSKNSAAHFEKALTGKNRVV